MDNEARIVEAIREVTSFLEGRGLDYAILGGVASFFWGRARPTSDVDLTVFVKPGGPAPLESYHWEVENRLNKGGDWYAQERVYGVSDRGCAGRG